MSIHAVAVLAAILCAAPLTVAAAQQAPDSARSAVPASSVQVHSPSTPLPGPRVSDRFQRAELTPAPFRTSDRSFFAAEGGRHVIVLSTLALVLIVVIVVLLIR